MREFEQILSRELDTEQGRDCLKLFLLVKEFIETDDNLSQLTAGPHKPQWAASALYIGHAIRNGTNEGIAKHLCIGLIQSHTPSIDEHVDHLQDRGLILKHSIDCGQDSPRLILRNHGLVFIASILLYPHQFLRRYYSSNFVGMPALLNRALREGAKVKIRIDPLRETIPSFYQDIREFDHWFGPPFPLNLLNDPHKATRTLHRSRGVHSLGYDVRFTIFRTKMMDVGLREFFIEEYCPLYGPDTRRSSGTGTKYVIQKFAHFCYDQRNSMFTHLDGAVRVFDIDAYDNIFHRIESGLDIGDKAGKRHKLFLVEGNLQHDLTQQLITEMV